MHIALVLSALYLTIPRVKFLTSINSHESNNPIHIYGSDFVSMCSCDGSLIFTAGGGTECCQQQERAILSINIPNFYVTIDGDSMCFTRKGKNISMLVLGDASYLGYSGCSAMATLTKPLLLDGYILRSMLAIEPPPLPYNGILNHNLICTAIETSISYTWHGLTPFAIERSRYVRAPSLALWLSSCHLSSGLALVHQSRPATAYATFAGDSVCRVYEVSNVRHVGSTDESKSLSILCMEDVLGLLASPPGSQPPGPLFLSQIGMEKFFGEKDDDSRLHDVHEIFEIIRAAQDVSAVPRLVVSSFWRGFAEVSRVVHSLSEGENDIRDTIRQIASSADQGELDRSSGLLMWNAEEWFGATFLDCGVTDTVRFAWNRRCLLNEVACPALSGTHHARSRQSIPPDSCTGEALGFRLGKGPKSFFSHFLSVLGKSTICDNKGADRKAFGDGPGGSSELILAIAASFNSSLREGEDDTACMHVKLNDHDELSEVAVASPSSPSSRWFASSTVHILLYVGRQDTETAVKIVQQWKQRCPMCVLIWNCVITPWDEDDVFVDFNASPRKEYADGLLFRFVLLHGTDFMKNVAVDNDVAVVLIGLAAARAFVPPGGTGLIPDIDKQPTATYHMHSALLFAMAEEQGQVGETVTGNDFSSSAFAGRAPDILRLLSRVADDPLSAVTDRAIYEVFRNNVRREFDQGSVDRSRRVFDFRRGGEHMDDVRDVDKLELESSIVDDLAETTTESEWDFPDTNSSQEWKDIYDKVMMANFRNGSYVKSLFAGLHILKRAPFETVSETVMLIGQIPRYFRYYSANTSLSEKKKMQGLLQKQLTTLRNLEARDLAGCEGNEVCADLVLDAMYDALHRALEEVTRDMGDWSAMIDIHQRRIPDLFRSDVMAARTSWAKQRKKLAKDKNGHHIVHYFTFATEKKGGLDHLLYSAAVSGINITVLGLGETWHDYYQKFVAYLNAISDLSVDESSVVVLMDAFDVLLFPRSKAFGQQLASAESPIVSCAENGIHIDKGGPWFYRRGLVDERASDAAKHHHLPARFVNSGCLIGRAGQMRQFLSDAFSFMRSHTDDQTATIMYYLSKPHLMTVDTRNDFFACVYKEQELFSLQVDYTDCSLIGASGKHLSAGLVHFNSGMYKEFANSIFSDIMKCVKGKEFPGHVTLS